MSETRQEATPSTSTRSSNKDAVRAYFARMAAGDPNVSDAFADDVSWWVPQGSSLAGMYVGKPAVLEMMGAGVGAYSTEVPFEIDIQRLLAEDDWVHAQLELRAAARDGTPYCNQYLFAVRLRGGLFVEVREYVDTKYVNETLGL